MRSMSSRKAVIVRFKVEPANENWQPLVQEPEDPFLRGWASIVGLDGAPRP